MIAIAADHVATSLQDLRFESRVRIVKLPARNGVDKHQPERIGGFHKRSGVRIMRQAHIIEPCLLDQLSIPVFGVWR